MSVPRTGTFNTVRELPCIRIQNAKFCSYSWCMLRSTTSAAFTEAPHIIISGTTWRERGGGRREEEEEEEEDSSNVLVVSK